MARAVLERARACGAVAVVGVGGGSCMDMAKLAATYAREPHAIEAIIEDSSLTTGAMPLVLIPTTAGTGAEASRVSMVSVNGAQAHRAQPVLRAAGRGARPVADHVVAARR